MLSRGSHAAPPGTEALRADRRDPASLAAVLCGRRFDLTVDLAAYDALGVETLWRVSDLQLGRYVMISSGQVYMITERGEPPFREPQSRRTLMSEPAEDSPDHPQWAYGVGKRGAEAVVMALRRHHGARAVILRLPVVHGEGDPTLRLWAWLERMLDGGPVLLMDGARRPTRFLDARDAGAAIARLAAGGMPPRAVYNLASPRILSLRRFLALAARAAGVSPRFLSIPARQVSALALDPVAWPFAGRWSSLLDPARAKRDLGFAGTPPEEWLPRVVRWDLEHRRGQHHEGYAQRARELEVAAGLERRAKGVKPRRPASDEGEAAGRAPA